MRRAAVLLVLSILLFPPVARGEEESPQAPPDAAALMAEVRRLSRVGRAHSKGGRHQQAIPLLERAVSMRRRLGIGADDDQIVDLTCLSFCYGSQTQFDDAAEGYQEVAILLGQRESPDSVLLPGVLTLAANNLDEAGRAQEAAETFDRAVEIWRQDYERDHPFLQRILREQVAHYDRLANVRDQGGRTEEATFYWKRSLAMCEARLAADHVEVARRLSDLGMRLYATGRHRGAIGYFRRSVGMRQRLDPGPTVAMARDLSYLGWCLDMVSAHVEAREAFEQCLEMNRALYPARGQEVALAIHNLGACLRRSGRPGEALPIFEDALALWDGLPPATDSLRAATLNSLAICLNDLGRPAEAMPFQRQALALYEQLYPDGHPELARVLANMGDNLCWRGLYRAALTWRQRSADMFARLYPKGHRDAAWSLCVWGDNLRVLGQVAEALEKLDQALTMFRAHAVMPHDDLVAALNRRVTCLLDVERFEDALPAAEEALRVSQQLYPEGHREVAGAWNNIGVCHLGLGDPEAALPCCRKALRIAESTRSAHLHSRATNVAWILLRLGRRDEAIPELRRAIAQIESMRRRTRGLVLRDRASFFRHLRRFNPYDLMAYIQAEGGNAEAALRTLEQGRARELLDLLDHSEVDPFERELALATRQGDEIRQARLLAVQRQVEEAEQVVNRARHALEHERGRRELAASDRRRKVEEATDALRAAREHYDVAIRRRQEELSGSVALGGVHSVAEIRAVLGPKEVILVYWVTDVGSKLLVVPGVGREIRILTLTAVDSDAELTPSQLAKAVDAYLAAIARHGQVTRSPLREDEASDAEETQEELARRGRVLFDALVPDGLWAQLQPMRRVYVVPHGALHHLPFEALVLPAREGDDGPRYWLDEGPPVVHVHSGSVLSACHERREKQLRRDPSGELVALGDPIYQPRAPGAAGMPFPAVGVLVARVPRDSAAARAGFEPGDVVLSYDGRAVPDDRAWHALAREVEDAIEDGLRPPGSVRVGVWRGGAPLEVEIDPGPIGVGLATAPLAQAWQAFREHREVAMEFRDGTGNRFGALKRLPHTRVEVERAVQAFTRGEGMVRQATKLLGADATESRLYQSAPRARYLLLATHGQAYETDEASFSALALTLPRHPSAEDDGALKLIDLLEHWRGRLEGCELVVLSACRTQRGEMLHDEGVFSLPWGFQYAGCPAVVASLWNVEDRRTADLMSAFFGRLARAEDATKLEAFTQARKALRQDHPSPFFWAPFIYIGDPR